MGYYLLSALINFIASIILGSIILIRNPRDKINYSFSLFAFAVAFWSLSYFFWQTSLNYTNALFWAKTLMAFAIFIPVFYLHFVFAWLGILKEKKMLLAFTYLVFFTFLLLDIFTSQFIAGIKPVLTFKFWPNPALFFHPFLIIWIASVIYASYLLYKTQKNATGFKKIQAKYILFGMIIGFIGGSTNYFLWYEIPVVPFGNILVAAYVGMTAYAIVKHRFLDIRLVVARSVAYTFLIVILGAMYGAGLFVVGAVFIGVSTTGGQLITSTILALAMAFTFQPLRRYLEKLTDNIFYKDHYDAQELLGKLSRIMASTIILEDLTKDLLSELFSQVKISRGALLLLKDKQITWVKTVGFHTPPTLDEAEIIKLTSTGGDNRANGNGSIHVLEELEEGDIKEVLRRNDMTLAVPLSVKGGEIGILLLGEKASGDLYSSEDLDVLGILAPEMAVAIQNAESFEEIRRFSITLQEEVDRATKELRDANEKLRVLDKLKDEFLSLATHELRTPMTAIKSYLWMIINRAATLDEEKKKLYMDRVYHSTERLINLVNELLNVSRIESGRLKLTPGQMDIVALSHEVADELSAKVNERSLTLTINDVKLPNVFADQDKIHEVLLNLIGNGIKFTERGGITVSFKEENGMVETAITDTGRGINKEDIGKLFQKFGRLDNTLVAIGETGGSGLGLYICKQLVELSGGKIWVDSQLDRGTTFTFSLPIFTPPNS